MAKAYREACAQGYNDSFKIKLNLVGFSESGKTSLGTRLSGETFKELTESTEGIETHRIESTFSKENFSSSKWYKRSLIPDDLRCEFNEFLLKSSAQGLRKDERETSKASLHHQLQGDNTKNDVLDASSEEEGDTSEKNPPPILPWKALGNTAEATGASLKNPADIKNISPEELVKLKNYKIRTPSKESGVPFTINLWDHGGQDEFIVTQHLFLDAEATTLLVMDLTRPFKKELKGNVRKIGVPNTPEQFLHYWLNALYTKVSEKDIQPSIALVLTHKDLIPPAEVDQYVADYTEAILNSLKMKPYSAYISAENIHVVDNKSGSENDFAKLRNQIFRMIAKQPGWGVKKPVRWFRLEADIIERAQKSSVKYLKYTDVKELASVYAMHEDEIQSFLKFHHTLGDLICYSDTELRHMVITDPQLLVDRFNELVTAHDFIDKRKFDPQISHELKQGTVSEENLKVIWKGYDIMFLMELMLKFNLMLPLDVASKSGRMFLIPSMLPPQNLNMYETEPFKKRMLTYNALHKPDIGDSLLIGTFHTLLSDCSKCPDWKICADHLSYTDASFDIGKEARLALTLLKDSIRVTIWCSKDSSYKDINSIIFNTKEDLTNKLLPLNISPGQKFLMLCPQWNEKDAETCLIEVTEEKVPDTNGRTVSAQKQKCPRYNLVM